MPSLRVLKQLCSTLKTYKFVTVTFQIKYQAIGNTGPWKTKAAKLKSFLNSVSVERMHYTRIQNETFIISQSCKFSI